MPYFEYFVYLSKSYDFLYYILHKRINIRSSVITYNNCIF